MATLEITPEMMNTIAKEIGGKIEDWDTAVKEIYTVEASLDSVWEGEAREAFREQLQNDKPKFDRLSELMKEYQTAIIDIARNYVDGDSEAKAIVSRR